MKWAIVNSGVVVKIVEGDFPEAYARSSGVIVVDVSDQPCQAGWILSGNKVGPINVQALVADRIRLYQEKAPVLLRDLYAANTLSGLTTPESDALCDAFADVILRLREGLWPTAIYRLQHKQPTLIATEARITEWIQLILKEMT